MYITNTIYCKMQTAQYVAFLVFMTLLCVGQAFRGPVLHNTGHCIMFSMITDIYNKKTKGPTLMELFTATEKLFFTTRDV
jgi:hypothetical protein